MRQYFKYIKIFFNSKWRFLPPKAKKILIYDGDNNPFNNYFSKKNLNIFYRRGEEINIFLVLRALINFKFTSDEYLHQFILFAKPKVIITAIDNYYKFYTLKKKFNIPTIFVQNGTRTMWEDIFANKKITNKKNKTYFEVDYMLVFNNLIGKKYGNFIKGKILPIGSFINNIKKKSIPFKRKKNEILFLSTYKPKKLEKRDRSKKINNMLFYKNDVAAIKNIFNFSKKRKIPFNVLGRRSGSESLIEENYFAKICDKKINFIPRFLKRKTYDIVDSYKYIVTIDSTLGIENLARGFRTAFLFNRPYKFPIYTRRYGGAENLPRTGPNWTTFNNDKEFDRVLNFLVSGKDTIWDKTHKNFTKKTMEFDPGNKKFLRIVKKLISK